MRTLNIYLIKSSRNLLSKMLVIIKALTTKIKKGYSTGRSPVLEMCEKVLDKLLGDKGYISKDLTNS